MKLNLTRVCCSLVSEDRSASPTMAARPVSSFLCRKANCVRVLPLAVRQPFLVRKCNIHRLAGRAASRGTLIVGAPAFSAPRVGRVCENRALNSFARLSRWRGCLRTWPGVSVEASVRGLAAGEAPLGERPRRRLRRRAERIGWPGKGSCTRKRQLLRPPRS